MLEFILGMFKPGRRILTQRDNYKLRYEDAIKHIQKHGNNIPPLFPSNRLIFEKDNFRDFDRWMEE